MTELALKVENLKKQYRLGVIGGETLYGDLQSWWAKVRGKEDPNTKIGTDVDTKKGTFYALKGINFEVKKGERLGIIGGNGAGKSTTLKILSRVTAPTEGTVYINGRISSMLEVGTGFHAELTGRENIYLNGAILGMSKAEVDEKIEDIIEFSECRQFIDTPVKRYSSGMYVKLAFAVAAHLDSEILIMDEVLAVGDMAFQKKCLNKMRDVSEHEGRTVLYVSHNMNTIRQLCDRCIVLDRGRVVFDGNVENAIGVYMNTNADYRVSFDYANIPRSVNETRKIELLGLDILDKENNKIIQGEKIFFDLHCKVNASVEDIKFRFEIFYADGTIVGTVFSDKSINGIVEQKLDIRMSLDSKNLTVGRYKCVMLAYEYDEQGNQIGVDRVDPAMAFEIVEPNGALVWLPQYWGHVKFDDMVIHNIKIK